MSASRLLGLQGTQHTPAQSTLVIRNSKHPGQESGLPNRGHLMVLNDTKLILNNLEVTHAHLGPIWYHSESSFLLPVSCSGPFFAVSYSKRTLVGWMTKRVHMKQTLLCHSILSFVSKPLMILSSMSYLVVWDIAQCAVQYVQCSVLSTVLSECTRAFCAPYPMIH